MTPVVKVLGLPKNLNHQALANIFSQFGEVANVEVEVNKITGRSTGNGVVRFETQDSANAAASAGQISKNGVELRIVSGTN